MTPALRFFNPHARIPAWTCLPGERWVLVAPTGWGKSQWLRQLTLLRDASESRVEWNGRVVEARDAAQYRKQWIFLAQTSYRSSDTVVAHLKEVAGLRGLSDVDAFVSHVRQALGDLGLGALDEKKRSLHELSGGELQVVSLLRTVLLSPEGIFLDEPTSAMDGALRLRTEAWLLQHFSGPFLWVSHDEEQVGRLLSTGAQLVHLPSAAPRVG